MLNEAHVAGLIATCYPDPLDVRGCKVMPGAKQIVGVVTGAELIKPTERGAIPDMLINLKGRSGKSVRVSVVENHVRFFGTWQQALEAAKEL